MDKKKIGIIGLSVAGLLALVLIFNGIFLNAKNNKNTENNKTTVSNSKENENKQDKEDKEDNNKQEDKENKKDEQNNQVNNESTTTENNKETNVNEIKNDKESSKNPTTSKPSTNNNSNSTTQEVKPQNQNTQTPKAQTVSISIDCKTAIASGLNNKKGFTHLPSSGVILSNMNVEIKEGDTVFDVLVKATRQKGIHMEYTGSGTSAYIEGIDNLYEFDAGSESGWRYTVNGKNVNYGCGAYKVKANDVIKFSYTCNLGKDLGDK